METKKEIVEEIARERSAQRKAELRIDYLKRKLLEMGPIHIGDKVRYKDKEDWISAFSVDERDGEICSVYYNTPKKDGTRGQAVKFLDYKVPGIEVIERARK